MAATQDLEDFLRVSNILYVLMGKMKNCYKNIYAGEIFKLN